MSSEIASGEEGEQAGTSEIASGEESEQAGSIPLLADIVGSYQDLIRTHTAITDCDKMAMEDTASIASVEVETCFSEAVGLSPKSITIAELEATGRYVRRERVTKLPGVISSWQQTPEADTSQMQIPEAQTSSCSTILQPKVAGFSPAAIAASTSSVPAASMVVTRQASAPQYREPTRPYSSAASTANTDHLVSAITQGVLNNIHKYSLENHAEIMQAVTSIPKDFRPILEAISSTDHANKPADLDPIMRAIENLMKATASPRHTAGDRNGLLEVLRSEMTRLNEDAKQSMLAAVSELQQQMTLSIRSEIKSAVASELLQQFDLLRQDIARLGEDCQGGVSNAVKEEVRDILPQIQFTEQVHEIQLDYNSLATAIGTGMQLDYSIINRILDEKFKDAMLDGTLSDGTQPDYSIIGRILDEKFKDIRLEVEIDHSEVISAVNKLQMQIDTMYNGSPNPLEASHVHEEIYQFRHRQDGAHLFESTSEIKHMDYIKPIVEQIAALRSEIVSTNAVNSQLRQPSFVQFQAAQDLSINTPEQVIPTSTSGALVPRLHMPPMPEAASPKFPAGLSRSPSAKREASPARDMGTYAGGPFSKPSGHWSMTCEQPKNVLTTDNTSALFSDVARTQKVKLFHNASLAAPVASTSASVIEQRIRSSIAAGPRCMSGLCMPSMPLQGNSVAHQAESKSPADH